MMVPEIQAAQMVRIRKHRLVPAKLMTSKVALPKMMPQRRSRIPEIPLKSLSQDQRMLRNPMLQLLHLSPWMLLLRRIRMC